MTPASPPDFAPSSWLQAWQQGLSQGHLQFGAWMRSALETQMDFALRQVIDATNPANCLATNPEAMQAALDSNGASLVEGACGETRFVLGASGHIAGVINPPAKNKRNHWVGDLAADAGAWLDGAQSVDGSWWPGWSDWLAEHAGAKVAARSALGSAEFPVIEPAPGRHVKAKAP